VLPPSSGPYLQEGLHNAPGDRLHQSFEDPASFKGSEEEILSEFRRIRDEVASYFHFRYTATPNADNCFSIRRFILLHIPAESGQ
jgi:hypothetical protein